MFRLQHSYPMGGKRVHTTCAPYDFGRREAQRHQELIEILRVFVVKFGRPTSATFCKKHNTRNTVMTPWPSILASMRSGCRGRGSRRGSAPGDAACPAVRDDPRYFGSMRIFPIMPGADGTGSNGGKELTGSIAPAVDGR